MVQLLLATVLLIILVALISIKSERLAGKSKWIIGILSVLLFVSVIIYEFSADRRSSTNKELALSFNQGKTLICKEYEVNTEKFYYIGGTKLFLGRENIQELKGVTIPIDACRLK